MNLKRMLGISAFFLVSLFAFSTVGLALVNQPPIANFTYEIKSIDGLLIYFNATSSYDIDGSIVFYQWNFGDGTIGYGPLTARDYASPGNYTVTLFVMDDGGKVNTTSKTLNLVKNQPPIASFTAFPTCSVAPPLTVNFDASASYDPDGSIVSYNWDFDDFQYDSGSMVTHTYTDYNIYFPRLVIKDNIGAYAGATRAVTVGSDWQEAPIAYAGPDLTGVAEQPITFNGTAYSKGQIVLYQWDFNRDNTQRTLTKLSEITVDNYTIILTNVDNSTPANIQVMVKKNGVFGGILKIYENDSGSFFGGNVTVFNDNSSTNANQAVIRVHVYEYTSQTTGITNYTYKNSGTYTAVFKITDNCGVTADDSATVSIASGPANQAPVANFTYTNATMFNYQFTDTSTDSDGTVVSWSWDFQNDGTNDSSLQNPAYTFSATGIYNVGLTVTDNDGATSSIIKTIYVNTNQPPVANAGPDMIITKDTTVNFTGNGTDPDGWITKYEWDFDGNGVFDFTSNTTGNASYTYTNLGRYNAMLRVTDNNGTTTNDTAVITVTLLGNKVPTANAGPDQFVNTGDVVKFVGTGFDPDGKIVLYEWDFNGDGTYDWSSEATGVTSYIYTTGGTYWVTLRVTDDAGLTATDQVYVTVSGPNVPSQGRTVRFDFSSDALNVVRIYNYDNIGVLTTYVLRVTNLKDENRSLLIRELIPKGFAKDVDDITFSVKPSIVYNKDPEVGWNETITPFDTFEVSLSFNKYISFENFSAMEDPVITEFRYENFTGEQPKPKGFDITGFVTGAFANPWLGLVIVAIVAALGIGYWKKDELRELWARFEARLE